MNRNEKQFVNPDMSSDEFKKVGYRVVDMMAAYYDTIRDVRVYPKTTAEAALDAFEESAPQNAIPVEKILDLWDEKILPFATHLGSPKYFGFVNGSGNQISVFAEALSACINMNLGGWKAGPSATSIEEVTIRWIAEMIGYPVDCGGLFTSGGTMANFTALLTALRNNAPYNTTDDGLQNPKFDKKFRVYMSDHEGHVSIVRVCDLMNLGRNSIQRIKSLSDFRMDVRDLERQILDDKEIGFYPLCVVAQVGSINTGSIDPLNDLADICDKHGLWLHADGACGALGAMLPEKRAQYAGLERADSVTLDPHKWLYIPYECGCVLVKDSEKLRRSYSMTAPYLRSSLPSENTGRYYLDYGPQMSRGFRAFKVWMSIQYYGVEGYRQLLRQNVQCVEYLHELVTASNDCVVLHQPNLLMYSFQYAPPLIRRHFNNDEQQINRAFDLINQWIADEIQDIGYAFLMTTKMNDRVVLRLSVCSSRTTLLDIGETFSKLMEIGDQQVEKYLSAI